MKAAGKIYDRQSNHKCRIVHVCDLLATLILARCVVEGNTCTDCRLVQSSNIIQFLALHVALGCPLCSILLARIAVLLGQLHLGHDVAW